MNNDVELWLVRHGETTHSVCGRVAGWTDAPLTETGRREAAELAPRLAGLRFDSVWSSDLDRAATTARLAWGEAMADHRLREFNFGELEGRRLLDLDPGIIKVFFEFHGFSAPGGESATQFSERVRAAIESLGEGRHLIFTHGGVIRELTRDRGLNRFLGTGSLVVLRGQARWVVGLWEPRPGPGPQTK